MTLSMNSVSENMQDKLKNLDPGDQKLFLAKKEKYIKRNINDSPLLDQLCYVHLIITRLSEGYSKALAGFEGKLDSQLSALESWRDSFSIKMDGEYESPMPWLHPLKLAGSELKPLEEELEADVLKGETQERDLKKLYKTMDQYQLRLPLPGDFLRQRNLPRGHMEK